MNQPSSYRGRFESADQVKSETVLYDRSVSGRTPVLRFPAAGRVVGAWIVSTVASSGTNVIQVGLRNGGVTGAGTVIVAGQSSGTVLAGSAYALTIDTSHEAFDAGEWVVLDVTTTQPTTDVFVQVDYVVDAF